MTPHPFLKWLLITVGALAVGLGVIGIFVPVLPTTPFLLLAAACFMRSSQRLYDWLIHHPWFGAYIRNYREYHAITPCDRAITLTILWGGIGATVLFAASTWWLRALLGGVAVSVTLHLFLLKTLKSERLHSKNHQIYEGGDV